MKIQLAGAGALAITLAVAGIITFSRPDSHAAEAAPYPPTKVALAPVLASTQQRFFTGAGKLDFHDEVFREGRVRTAR